MLVLAVWFVSVCIWSSMYYLSRERSRQIAVAPGGRATHRRPSTIPGDDLIDDVIDADAGAESLAWTALDELQLNRLLKRTSS